MGREIRRVTPDWEHPISELCGHNKKCYPRCFQPLFDKDYRTAATEWMASYETWRSEGCQPDGYDGIFFWEWEAPPDPEHYRIRCWTPEEATHFQIYETVSEGTPVSPHFGTKAELVDYLVEHGDFWDQKRGDGGWTREAAEKFVADGFAVSMVMVGGRFFEPRDGQP